MTNNTHFPIPEHFEFGYAETLEYYAKMFARASEKGEEDVRRLKRDLGSTDLFFLLGYILNRKEIISKPWLFRRCREWQSNPNGYLDLWAREHYKSTVITFAGTIFEIINDPEVTIGIFSHTKSIARGFVRQIKEELEQNETLKKLWPDIFYEEPARESNRWSIDGGIIVKRKSNPKEATVEGHGLVDGQPTGLHFKGRVYDDVVTLESVSTPEQIEKTTYSWQMSDNLGSEGGWERYIGTRYHLFDTYSVMIDRKAVVPRVHPATINGHEDGKPVLMTRETLRKKRITQGPYVFACFPKGSPVLMSDWTEKPIEQVEVGDELVGYDFPKNKKTKLVRSKVIAKNTRMLDVYEYTFASGRVVKCTKEHKWYTGRRGKDVGGSDNHSAYLHLGFKKHELKSLISVYDPRGINAQYSERDAAWLGGFFDGEGSVSGGCIHIHQSKTHNPDVCVALENILDRLGFDYGVTDRHSKSLVNEKYGHGRDYYIRGGRQEKIRFLNICKPIKKSKIEDFLFQQGTREFGKACRDSLVSIKHLGKQRVYNIETETGNYVCYGYATKNSQMLLNPTADKAMGFNTKWLVYADVDYDAAMRQLWRFILVDPAGSKQRKNNDFTTFFVIGHGADKKFRVLDIVRDRLNLTGRTEKLFELHEKWKPHLVAYEEYGMQADIEHIEYVMKEKLYEFEITSLGGSMKKELRILRLVPYFENGFKEGDDEGKSRIILPTSRNYIDYQQMNRDLVKDFVEQEYEAFPVLNHDDMLDCMARLCDLEEKGLIELPKIEPPKRKGITFHEGIGKIGNTGDRSWVTA